MQHADVIITPGWGCRTNPSITEGGNTLWSHGSYDGSVDGVMSVVKEGESLNRVVAMCYVAIPIAT